MQASLPIQDGGLGLRRVSSLASSTYLASAVCTLELQSAILTKCTNAYFEEVLAACHDTLPVVIDPLPVKQGAWDNKDRMSILASMRNPFDRARMAAACFPHSGDGGLLKDTWPGMPQWSTLVLHHPCRRQQSLQVLQLCRLLFTRLPNMHCCLQPMCLSPLPSKLLGL